jgi:hypothetical protein
MLDSLAKAKAGIDAESLARNAGRQQGSMRSRRKAITSATTSVYDGASCMSAACPACA